MAWSKVWLVGAVILAFAFNALAPVQAAGRLSEKNIIKRLVIKKKPRTQRPVQRQRKVRRNVTRDTNRVLKRTTTRRTLTTRRRTLTKAPRVVRRKTLTIRKTRVTNRRTREEFRSLKRRKTLRRILTKKRTRTRTRTRKIQKRIAFPPPAIEIADGVSTTPRPDRPRPPQNTGGQGGSKQGGSRTGGTKWVRTTPRPSKSRKRIVRKKNTLRPTTRIVRQATRRVIRPARQIVTQPVKVATTRIERDQIQQIVQTEGLPQIDIEIYFDYNSATIRPQSMPDIGTLGRALRNKQLAGSQFMIIGHTDASGSDSYNLTLSEARANAVRDFLVNIFGLEGEKFFPMGYGEEQLKRRDRPDHAENRRVQIVNIGGQTVADTNDGEVEVSEVELPEEDIYDGEVSALTEDGGVPDDQ